MSMYHPIGEPFSADGITLQAVESKAVCFECYCKNREELCQELRCTVGAREDKKDVVFKEVTQ